MQINQISLNRCLSGEQQFIVPIYHRQYVWNEPQWATFWADIIAICEQPTADPYFIGNIVVKPLATKAYDIKKLSIIDGQQRLVTISIILSVLRDLYIEDDTLTDAKKETKRLLNLVSNSASYETEDCEYSKIIFGTTDTAIAQDFLAIISGNYTTKENNKKNSLIAKAYIYFQQAIIKSGLEYRAISYTITDKLCIANIELEPISDNPDFIFESLNATGLKLSSIDLIRNSFFMDIPLQEQTDLYNKYWLPIEEAFGYDKEFTEFIRIYIAKDGIIVYEKDFYQYLRKEITKNAQEKLRDIHYFFKIYQILKNPALAKTEAIQKQMLRINSLVRLNANALLINCFNDYQQKIITDAQLLQILQIVENFAVRTIFCNTQKCDTKFFSLIYKEIKKDIINSLFSLSFVQSLKNKLASKNYPNDNYFRKYFAYARMNISHGLESNLALFMLKEIEYKYAHKEQVNLNESELAFILPKRDINNLPKWQKELGDNWQELHSIYAQTFINCTLVSKESNFEEKNTGFNEVKSILEHSKLNLNKAVCTNKTWTESVMLERGESLANQAITLWAYFGENEATTFEREQTFDKLIFLNKEFPIKSWRDVFRYTIERLLQVLPQSIDSILAKFTHSVSKDKAKFKEAIPVGLDYFIEKENKQGARIEQQCRNLIEDLDLADNWKIIYKDKI